MKLANAFDGIDSAGKPILSVGRTVVSDPDERARIEQFMNGGGFVLGTGRRAVDIIDPGRGRVVLTIYKTDGEWVWPMSIFYYLAEHDVPIETEFLNHIRSCEYASAVPDETQIRLALRFLENEFWVLEVCLVRIKSDGDWVAAFVIDGRNYASREEYERVVAEAFDAVNASRLVAEFETGAIGAAEPAFRLPSWEQYRESLDLPR